MSRMFLMITMYVAAPAYAYFEAVGFPEGTVNSSVALAAQLVRTITG